MAEDVQLFINGKIYEGWKKVSVRRSLDLFADSFELTLTDNRAGDARIIKLGSPCRVMIDNEPLITGFVDRIKPSYDANGRQLTLAGRSKTADLVDCSPPPQGNGAGQRNTQTLLHLATTIAGHFGIKVRSEVTGLEPIQSVLEYGQTPFEFLEVHARAAAVRLVSDPDGNIVIVKESKAKVKTALVLGENIEAADGEFSERDRFSHYYFFGQRSSLDGDGGDAESCAHISGLAEDINMRYRPNVMIAEGVLDGSGMAKRRAEWQRNIQYGRSRQAVYTVSGWRHEDGLWKPNTNVLVKDEWMGFNGKDGKGAWLMIGTVEFVLDDGGKRTRLTVMPKEAYDLIPLPAEDEEWG
ncbi:MAG: hypothetical protein KAV87_27120 [Desulfobacteraceae bacterium]|nr:hypothetical protein [Desulfobacteraceae bacterium]